MPRIFLTIVAISILATIGCASSNTYARYPQGYRDSDASLASFDERQRPTPMSNEDVIRMKAAGVSDELVLKSISHRGGEFDLSPDGVIQLSQNNVPDTLITAIQDLGEEEVQVVPASATRSLAPPPRRTIVVVAPPFARAHHHHYHRPRVSRRRSGASISIGHGF